MLYLSKVTCLVLQIYIIMSFDEKIKIKNEPTPEDVTNPWLVDSVQAFTYLKCPECVFDTKEVHNFQAHALEKSSIINSAFWKRKSIKTRKIG